MIAHGASRTIARKVRELRDRRGWSAARLAERCAEAGAPELSALVIANIETRRHKRVTAEELLILCYVLDASLGDLVGSVRAEECVKRGVS